MASSIVKLCFGVGLFAVALMIIDLVRERRRKAAEARRRLKDYARRVAGGRS